MVYLTNMDEIILSDFFNTKQQANEFSERLREVQENIFEVGFDLEKELESKLGVKRKDKFLSLLREHKIPLESNSQLSGFFEKIHETIKSLPLLEITIAIDPSGSVLKTISDWFILNIKKQVLLEVNTDTKIIAGAILEFNGKRFDSSIKVDFEEVCTKNLTNSM